MKIKVVSRTDRNEEIFDISPQDNSFLCPKCQGQIIDYEDSNSPQVEFIPNVICPNCNTEFAFLR